MGEIHAWHYHIYYVDNIEYSRIQDLLYLLRRAKPRVLVMLYEAYPRGIAKGLLPPLSLVPRPHPSPEKVAWYTLFVHVYVFMVIVKYQIFTSVHCYIYEPCIICFTKVKSEDSKL